jgi:ribosomal protein S6--L-glutamate ligase
MAKKFLILGSVNYANRRIKSELKQRGYNSIIIEPSTILPFVSDTAAKTLYVRSDGDDEPEEIKVSDILGIIPRIGGGLQFHARTVEYLINLGIPSTAKATALLNAQDKVRTTHLLAVNGLNVPKTIATKEPAHLNWIVEELGGFPIVAKLIYGSRGIGVFILTEPLSASTSLSAFASQGHAFLLTQFIETAEKDKNKHDFRVVVVNGEVVAAFRRNSVGSDFRTNASIKDNGEKCELDDDMKAFAIQAAAAVGLDCAGVDLARDVKTKKVYCYEVNGNFDFKACEKHSGKNVASKIVEYAIFLSEMAKNDKISDGNSEMSAIKGFALAQSFNDFKTEFTKWFQKESKRNPTDNEINLCLTVVNSHRKTNGFAEIAAEKPKKDDPLKDLPFHKRLFARFKDKKSDYEKMLDDVDDTDL